MAQPMLLEPRVVWFSIQNGGDGSAYPAWFLTEAEAKKDQEDMYEGWGELCIGSVETFKGSDIWRSGLSKRCPDCKGDGYLYDHKNPDKTKRAIRCTHPKAKEFLE